MGGDREQSSLYIVGYVQFLCVIAYDSMSAHIFFRNRETFLVDAWLKNGHFTLHKKRRSQITHFLANIYVGLFN